jgi:tetratricopeptide (TPR) repeat protein
MKASQLLRRQARDVFNAKKYAEAIKLFTQALSLPNLTDEERAILCSNRSAAYCALDQNQDNFQKAYEDAKLATTLLPNWTKGYYRKGKALHCLGRYEKAIKGIDW